MWAYEIFIPIAIVVGIGLVLGLVLAVAAIILHVPVDERVEAVTEVLPGANCGACGFAGCDDYANALAENPELGTGLCPFVKDSLLPGIYFQGLPRAV